MSLPVSNVNRLVPGLIEKTGNTDKKAEDVPSGGSFKDHLTGMIGAVNDVQSQSAQAQDMYLSGGPVELHEVMIKAEEAGLAMDLLLEVRNRLVEGYQEIMRMPV